MREKECVLIRAVHAHCVTTIDIKIGGDMDFEINTVFGMIMAFIIGSIMILIGDKTLRSGNPPTLQFWTIRFFYAVGTVLLTISILTVLERFF